MFRVSLDSNLKENYICKKGFETEKKSAHLNAKSRPIKRRKLIIVQRRRHRGLHRQSLVLFLNSHDHSVGSLGSLNVNAECENTALHHEIFLTVGVGQDRSVAGWRVGLVLRESQQDLALNKTGFTRLPTQQY